MTTAIANGITERPLLNQSPPSAPFRVIQWEDKHSWEILAKESDYQPRKLAKLCGVSMRTLQRHFAKQHGMKVTEWLRSIRLTEAYRRIKSGDRVKEVSIDLGFKQLSHFSREFKRQHGVPPSFLNGSRLLLGERVPVCHYER